ncbi:hypothetical protein SORA22_08280 [Streptococcus oralis]|jgi:phage protein|uniref:Phage protein n=2 Tax=unclassified Caudoviricetes TaxID=2788787 RepID=A0A8S5QHW7_9CAUD|nr:MAG: hypothetical protein D8H99_28810 [Streptococcus sp.]UJD17752.1 hypothetical protein OlisA2_0039 [Streptococcus phage OlisA2]DAE12780.1 MAG TPA: hypothetical protein [Siphoviridae sp. ctL053]DAE18910.1 MAG TPA: hypothetical protein [Siphoviridae sp. ctNPp8]DAX88287.1 MAG TPA: hypothetical protein [Caudoviricetes sp.]
MSKKIKGTTESGFEFETTERRLNNFLLLRYIGKADKGDIEAVDKVLELILGKEQSDAFIDHLTEEDGILPNEKIFSDIKSIFESVKEIKKS